MSCLSPRDAWPPPPGSADRRFVYSPAKSYAGAVPRKLPCGQCVACLLDKARDWSTRALHELQMHGGIGAFLTCTLADEHMPPGGSLSVTLHQQFMQRLRHRYGSFRFLGCGEYGSQRKRLHYHYLIFGLDFPDKVPWSMGDSGEVLYRSPSLDETWRMGHVLIGAITAKSADYVARYTTKKLDGSTSEERYRRADPVTGEVYQVRPEKLFCSRRPGIGMPWFEAFKADAFPSDFIVINGERRPVPRAYAKRLIGIEALKKMVRGRAAGRARAADNTGARLATRLELRKLRFARLQRSMED